MKKYNITMFFPSYNEEKNINKLIKNAKKVLEDVANKYEILIVNYDGSKDNTEKIVKEISKNDKHVKLIHQPINKKGVGYAIKLGFENAKYPYIFYSDSDNQFDLDEFKKIIPFIDSYDIIAGYRINRKDPFLRVFTSKIYNLVIRLVFGVKERDVDCAFRFVNRRIFDKIKLICKLGVGTTELLVKAKKYGYKIKQVGVHHYPRMAGKSIFETKGLSLPRFNVVINLIKEIRLLKKLK